MYMFCQHHFPSVTEEPPVSSAHPVGHPWRIVSAVCVQRMPSLSREKTEMELRYEELKDTVRAERSRMSDFELEGAEHFKTKKERQRRALKEDLDETQVCLYVGMCTSLFCLLCDVHVHVQMYHTMCVHNRD